MRRCSIIATVSALALLASLSPAMAQDAAELRVGAEVAGDLTDRDGRAGAGEEAYRYDDFRITGREGQRLEAVLRSGAFDAYLALFEDGSTDSEPLATDDDGLGDGTDARLRFTPEHNGTYILRARTLSGLTGGDYSLSLKERAPAPRAPRPRPVAVGASVQGALDARDPETDDGANYDAYLLRARQGERVAIRLNADDFDPVLAVGRADRGGDFRELARNDDAGSGGLNSYLVFTAPEAGDYIVRASAVSGGGTGDYTLSLEQGPAPAPTQPIAVGDTVRGELAEGDGANDEGVRADGYRFTGRAGQRIAAELTSAAFDAYLELYRDTGGMLESVDEDDDSAGDTNARLSHVLPADGDYVIEARAFGDDATGAYTLKLTETAPEPAPAALTFGATVQGEIADADPRDDDGRGFDAYAFSATEGGRIQAVMRSGDFDTFLQIGRAGDAFEMLVSDDDGLGEGTDSRLNYIIPETGDYVLRASPLNAEEKGLYSIELIDRGPQPVAGSLLIGATARGTLTESDAIADDGSYFDAYRVQAKKDDKLVITMVSNDFDAFLDVGSEDDAGAFTSIVTDDDSLSDTHARVEWTAPDDGTYVIRARGFSQSELGAYAMTVERDR